MLALQKERPDSVEGHGPTRHASADYHRDDGPSGRAWPRQRTV